MFADFRAIPLAWAAKGLRLAEPQAFSFEDLVERARAKAAAPYAPLPPLAHEILERIDYAAHGKIKFKTDYALFADGPGRYPVTFFHLGRYFQSPVRMHVVADGKAREIVYDTSYFDMPADSPAHALPRNAGFAGFRMQESRLQNELDWHKNDWVAFLGASYFRAIGELHQYGMSARGVAVNVAVAGPPGVIPGLYGRLFRCRPDRRQRRHPPPPPAPSSTAPSIAGAYRFKMQRTEAVIMEVEAALFQAQRHRAPGPGPAHVDVLVLRDRQSHRHRLASGSA